MSPPPASPSERLLALRLLDEHRTHDQPPDMSPDWTDASPLVREMVMTSLRHQGALDAWIDHMSRRPPDEALRPLLRLGLCQLLLLDGVADHAAVHETLEAAKAYKVPKPLVGFANALFRRATREPEALHAWLAKQPPSVRLSHPSFMLDRWKKTYGMEEAIRMCEWNQQRSVTYARLTLRGKELGVADALPEGSEPHTRFPDFIRLPRGATPTDLPGFDQGAWYLQDPSTSLAPALLNVTPGETVLDACAAPGGKTALLAEALRDHTRLLTAADPNPRRLHRLRENLYRLRLDEVRVLQAEPHQLDQAFDAILLDVPCSNTGVYQRRPDAKWTFRKRSLKQLTALQSRLLTDAAKHVRPGGRIVYSTCGIEEEETRGQVTAWLHDRSDWCLEEDILLRPGERECDGAYAARLRNLSSTA